MTYGSTVPGFDAYNSTFGTNTLSAVPSATQNALFRFAGSALDAKTRQWVTKLNTEAQLLAQMPQQQKKQGFGIGDIASLGLKGLSLAGGLGAFGGGGTDVFGGWTDFGTGSGPNYVSDIGRVMF